MWGRVILHKKLLSVHGQRILYCDTDSAIVYLMPGDTVPFVGNGLGDLVDELPKMLKDKDCLHFTDPYFSEGAFVVAKTYGLEITDGVTGEVCHKVTSKGFEPTYKNSLVMNFKAFNELVHTQHDLNTFYNGKRPRGPEEQVAIRNRITTEQGFCFVSSIVNNEIKPGETYRVKSITGNYTKGKVHPEDPRFIIPFGPFAPPPGTFLNSKISGEYK